VPLIRPHIASIKHSVHFGELFDFLEDVVAWVKDHEGRYIWVNRAFRNNYALEHSGSEAEVLGKTDYDFSPAFLADQYRLDDEQVLEGKRIVDRVERVGESEGTIVWSVTNKIPVRDASGAIVGTAGITRTQNQPIRLGRAAPDFSAVLAYMREHYERPISNQQLAGVAKMSLRAFERQFVKSFHATPQKYLRKLRLRIASRALLYSKEPLAEVAVACGFGDQSHFTREFRRQFGFTPREYRERHKVAGDVSGINSAGLGQD
jgi:AraC-like DNA-binding protein